MAAASEKAGKSAWYSRPFRAAKAVVGAKGWRRSLVFGCVTSSLALLINLAAVIWAFLQPSQADSTIVLYRGPQDQMKQVNLWVHVGTTLLSTLLLMGGNACMQVMMAPTREELDFQHSRGVWLDIGTSGFRNLDAVSLKRKFIWFMAALCSIPVHLIYNSVVFPTMVATNYAATLVTQDFPTGQPFDLEANNVAFTYSGSLDGSVFQQLQGSIDSLVRLDNHDCIQALSNRYVDNYLNVLLVSNTEFANNSILNGWIITSTPEYSDDDNYSGDPRSWICDSANASLCAAGNYEAVASDWQLSWSNPVVSDRVEVDPRWQLAQVQYCLLQPFEPQNAVLLSTPLLLTVFVVNAALLLFVAWAASMADLQPLITTGDAIASFLEKPDPTTARTSLLTVKDVRHGVWSPRQQQQAAPRVWDDRRSRWGAAVSVRRWAITMAACVIVWVLGLLLMVLGLNFRSASFHELLVAGLGTVVPESLVGFFGNLSSTNAALLANIPQLALSVIYYLYNGIFTAMVASHEYTSYASQLSSTADEPGLVAPKHKPHLHHAGSRAWARVRRRPVSDEAETLTPQAAGLRVSAASGPVGAQRGTYMLNLPFRYALPIMVASIALHYFASQAVFPAQISTVNNDGTTSPDYYVQTCAWSALALTAALAVGAAMIIALLAFAGLRRFHGGVPVAGSCSAAISAACHGLDDDEVDLDAPRWPVSYGVLGQVPGADGVHRAGFGSGRIYPLEEGEAYI